MPRAQYRGATPAADPDLVNKAYLETLLGQNLTQLQVDNLIAAGYSPYAGKSYVDTQDALNATAAYVDAGDATRLHQSQRNANSGVVGLDANGRADYARTPSISSQRWPAVQYGTDTGAAVSATSTEVTVFSQAIADPGYTYKLMVTGQIDCKSTADGSAPLFNVRAGTATGEVVARGMGVAENYTARSITTTHYNAGDFTYSIPVGSTSLDVVAIGAGGAGGPLIFTFSPGMGGTAGQWASATLVRGTDIPNGTTQLGVSVAPSPTNANGVATTVAGTGWAGLSAAGGTLAGASSTTGLSPGNHFRNGWYYGGATAAGNVNGHAPGGGGGGANGFFGGVQGTGGAGGVWIVSYTDVGNDPTLTNGGTATLIPFALSQMTPITGATTVYVRLVHSAGSATVNTTASRTHLCAYPIPV